jgi:hypothetical protein
MRANYAQEKKPVAYGNSGTYTECAARLCFFTPHGATIPRGSEAEEAWLHGKTVRANVTEKFPRATKPWAWLLARRINRTAFSGEFPFLCAQLRGQTG